MADWLVFLARFEQADAAGAVKEELAAERAAHAELRQRHAALEASAGDAAEDAAAATLRAQKLEARSPRFRASGPEKHGKTFSGQCFIIQTLFVQVNLAAFLQIGPDV